MRLTKSSWALTSFTNHLLTSVHALLIVGSNRGNLRMAAVLTTRLSRYSWMHFSITSYLFIPLSFSPVFEFSWMEMCRINKIAVPPSLPPWLSSLLTVTVQWRHQRHIKRQRGGEIKVISLYLPLFFIFSELCIYSIPTSSVFHFLSFPPFSPPQCSPLSHGGEIS